METITIENEQLIKRYEIKDTPFVIVCLDDVYFGTMGQYKITNDYATKEEAEEATTRLTWNNITNLIILLNELLNKQKP